MTIDSEAYWLEQLSQKDEHIHQLVKEKDALFSFIHVLNGEIAEKNARIHELEAQMIELQKREFHANEY